MQYIRQIKGLNDEFFFTLVTVSDKARWKEKPGAGSRYKTTERPITREEFEDKLAQKLELDGGDAMINPKYQIQP